MSSLADRRSIEAFLSAHENLVEPTLYEIGQCVDAWRIVAFLGRGGSGEVYRVEHLKLGVIAAMKILTRDDAHSQDRFRREAAILASYSHPSFPRFLGYGEIIGRPYLVIELLDDYKLPSTDRAVARYLRLVCEGVSFLHSLGLVHRDIKPSNILCRKKDGQPVLIDLGLVKDTNLSAVHGGESLSLVNGKAVGVGTPRYSAPEQFSGGMISPVADVHALGTLANECFGGKPPRSWSRIIRRSTSSIPSQRYKSADEFACAIRNRHSIQLLIVMLAILLVAGVVAITSVVRNLSRSALKISAIDALPVAVDVVKTNVQYSAGSNSNKLNRINSPIRPLTNTTKSIERKMRIFRGDTDADPYF